MVSMADSIVNKRLREEKPAFPFFSWLIFEINMSTCQFCGEAICVVKYVFCRETFFVENQIHMLLGARGVCPQDKLFLVSFSFKKYSEYFPNNDDIGGDRKSDAKYFLFLDTQVSLALTHVRKLVRWSVGHTFRFPKSEKWEAKSEKKLNTTPQHS